MAFLGSYKARARARRGWRALQRAPHGGIEVAAGGLLWAAWHGRGGSSAKQEAVERVGSDVWVPARSRGGRLALHGAGDTAQRRRRKTEQAGRLEVEERTGLQFLKFQGTKL